MQPKGYVVLIAEDNVDDAFLLRRSLKRAGINNPVHIVTDGEQVIDYMEGKGAYADRSAHPMPALVVLDIKMPKVTGLEVLEWICAHPEFKVVPTVMFTSSQHEYDICKAFKLGAHGFFIKPNDAQETEKLFCLIRDYWNVSHKPNPSRCHEILSAEAGKNPAPT